MFVVIALVALLGLVSPVYGACTLTWDAPTTNEDGTPLTVPVERYEVYVGAASDPLLMARALPEPTTTQVACLDIGLARGMWVALKAVNAQGTSTFSASLHNMPPGIAENAKVRGRD